MKLQKALLVLLVTLTAVAVGSLIDRNKPPHQEESKLLVSLGINNNLLLTESSGLAYSRFGENSIWTLNDSGHSNDLLLLKTDGTLQAQVSISGATNIDWEAMAGFKIDDQPYLVIADVGDNNSRRKTYQLYLLPEPDLGILIQGAKTPIARSVKATTLQFTYEDGPKNCEAIGVDVIGKQIWLVEKVSYTSSKKTPSGIYALPLTLPLNPAVREKPLIAKRIADFPPRNVTGMDFSPDGKKMIIRNYVNAHLYSREGDATWESVVTNTKPKTVVLPLQRQGEAICFSPDSQSVILTSEFRRQPIWQVNLQHSLSPVGKSTQKKSTED